MIRVMQKRWVGFFSLCILLAGTMAFNAYNPFVGTSQTNGSYSYSPISIEVRSPKVLYGINVDEYVVVEDKVKKNQFLSDIFTEYNVPVHLVNQVSSIPRKLFDVRKVAANKKYTVIYKEDSLKTAKAFIYESNPIDYVVFTFDDSL